MLHKFSDNRPDVAVSCRLLGGVVLVFLIVCASGAVAQTARVNDADLDTVPDTVDVDDDNDGILDRFEITASGSDIDSDGDGLPNRLDVDSDNDGISDLQESGAFLLPAIAAARVVNGRLRTPVGLNGFADVLETAVDNSVPAFRLLNSDEADGDVLPDYLDLDSDNDSLPDLIEAGAPASLDGNRDGRIDVSPSEVGADGVADRIQLNNDANCCDFDGDGVEDTVPRNSDGGDLPDYLDVDSDNDGVFVLVEAGGNDLDADGRIDGFFDNPENPDGVDDAILLVPYTPLDINGDSIPDYIQFDVSATASSSQPDPTPTEFVENAPAAEPPNLTPVVPDPAINPQPVLPIIIVDTDVNQAVSSELPAEEQPIAQGLPQNDDTLSPITTGLTGGCVIQTGSTRIDPLLPILLLLALLGLVRRKHRNTFRLFP